MQKDNKVDDIVYSHWLDPETYRIKKVSVYDFKTNRSLNCQFEDHKNINGQYFPHKVRLSIKADKNIEVELSYSKITLNKPIKFSFKVPERFGKID